MNETIKNYKEIFDHSPIGIAIIDTFSGKICEANQAFSDITGRSIVELNSLHWMDFTYPDDITSTEALITELTIGKKNSIQFKKRYVKPDNSLVWVKMTITRIISTNIIHHQHFCMVQDITPLKKMEQSLLQEQICLETTLNMIEDGIVYTDNRGNITRFNHAAANLMGLDKDDLLGKPINQVYHFSNYINKNGYEDIVGQVLDGEHPNGIIRTGVFLSNNSLEITIEEYAYPILTDNKSISGVILIFKDISEKTINANEIIYLNYHDYLTGIYNRRFYEEELQRLDTKRNLPLSLIIADVNGLKLVNDSFGHALGDELLKKVAIVMSLGCRTDDIIARLGGDEFVLLLPKTNQKDALLLIQRLNILLEKEKVGVVSISVSFGTCSKKNIQENMYDVFKYAENQLYRNKLYNSSSNKRKTIDLIITTLFEKSKREMMHSKRVSQLCSDLAQCLNLSDDDIKHVGLAGLMHDIGKIGIDEKILNKPSGLTKAEFKEIERHPEIGYRILSSVNEFSEIAGYVLEHQERWDGSGYPKGLKGNDISIEARIIAIADAYDAMTSIRTYNNETSIKDAVSEVKRCSGTQFDPYISTVFIDYITGKTVT